MGDQGRRRLVVLVVFTTLAILCSACTFITRASVDSSGGDASASSFGSDFSADGRYLVFTSFAEDIVPPDGNEVFDVFRRDLLTGTTTRVSVDMNGGDPNGSSVGAQVSADGRYVAFDSFASDLVSGDGNGVHDVFRRDLLTGSTTRVSIDTGGGSPNGASFLGGMSADGRYIAFQSDANDLVPGDGTGGLNVSDVFVRDTISATTTRVSVDTTGGDPDESSGTATISADGSVVAFFSRASDLVPGDDNAESDVFVRSLQTDVANVTTRVSVDMNGNDSNGPSIFAGLSDDGHYVTFNSDASDLVPDDGTTDGPARDVFVRDLMAGVTTRVSVDTNGEDANDRSGGVAISGDGRYVAFESVASDLIPGDAISNGTDVFVRDLERGVTTRATEDGFGGAVPGGPSEGAGPALSPDGRYVAFHSEVPGLVSGDNNGDWDVFVRAVVEPAVESVSPPSVARGTTATLNVTGNGFLPGTQVSLSTFSPPGVEVESITVVSETELDVSVSIDPTAATGTRNVMVWPPGTGPGALATGFGVCGGCLTVT